MRNGLIFPLELNFRRAGIATPAQACAYVERTISMLRAAAVEIVDWSFDPASPLPVLAGDRYDARVRVLIPGEEREFGAILVRVLLHAGDMPDNLGVAMTSHPQNFPIDHDYMPGLAFPSIQA